MSSATDFGKPEKVIEKTIPYLDAYKEYFKPTPVPIIGPLIDYFRWR